MADAIPIAPDVTCKVADVIPIAPDVTCNMADVIPIAPDVTCNMADVIPIAPDVTCNMADVIPIAPDVTCNMADVIPIAPDVTCSVCLEIFSDPLILTCQHSFCRKCLAEIQAKANKDSQQGAVGGVETLTCPNCRKETLLGEHGTDGLPANFTLSNIVDRLRANITTLKVTEINVEERGHIEKDKGHEVMFCQTCETSLPSSESVNHPGHIVQNLKDAVEREKIRLKGLRVEVESFRVKQTTFREHASLEYEEMKINVADELSDMEKRYSDFKMSSQQLITTLMKIQTKASLVDMPDPTVEDMTTFLKMAKGLSTDISELGSPKHFKSGKSMEDKSTQVAAVSKIQIPGPAIQIEKVVNVPTCTDMASIKIKLSHYDINDTVTVKCFRNTSLDSQNDYEVVHRNVGSRLLKFDGLHHDMDYTVEVIRERRGHEQQLSKKRFHTSEKVKCNWNCWDPINCHPSMVVSESGKTVCHKNHADAVLDNSRRVTHGQLRGAQAICALRPLKNGLHYWEMTLKYTIEKHLSPGDIIINVGLCNKENWNGSSLSESNACTFVQLYKKSRKPEIGIKFWEDGYEMAKSAKSFRIKLDKERTVNLGFFIDFYRSELKIILVKSDKFIHAFKSHDEECNYPICQFQNEEKVETSVKLKTASIKSLPTVLT